MSEKHHKAPLQKEVPVEITRHPSRDYREIAESVGTILSSKAAFAAEKGKRERTEKLLATANLDVVTGLPSKRQFEHDREALVQRAERGNRSLGLAVIDGLGFKRINDDYGHQTGDNALRLIGKGIEAGVRPTDRVYRVGGDEFAVLMPDYGVDADVPEPDLNKTTSARIENGLAERITEAGFPVTILGVSVGIGIMQPGEDWTAFYDRVDAAMYEHKQQQKIEMDIAPRT